MFDNEKFLKAVTKSFRNYQKFGARSNKKLLPLHKFVADTIKEFANDYKFHYYEENGEFKISGKYYNKDVDIVLTKNNSPILGVGVKFITSNYKQNSNNYFENMLGETANIQSNNIPYFHFIVLRHKTPYYDKNGNLKKIETISESDILKYLKLSVDCNYPHKPKTIGLLFIDILEKDNKVEILPFDKIFSDEFAKLLELNLSPKKLFENIDNYLKIGKL